MTVNLPAFTINPPQIQHQKSTFCTACLPKPQAKTPVIQPRKKTAKAFLLRGSCLLTRGGEAKGVVILFEFEAEGFDNQVVVVALR
jgi:hypothetical protein